MAYPLLNTHSVIMCPHGGIVQHVPTTTTSFRLGGWRPMLLSDTYLIAGCPFQTQRPSPCAMVTWVTGSQLLFVKGQPVLTLASTGICYSVSGAPQGPAMILQTQAAQMEPDVPTFINE